MVGTQIAFLNSGSKISATCLRYKEKDPRHKLGDLSSSTGSVINKLYNLGCITSSHLCFGFLICTVRRLDLMLPGDLPVLKDDNSR